MISFPRLHSNFFASISDILTSSSNRFTQLINDPSRPVHPSAGILIRLLPDYFGGSHLSPSRRLLAAFDQDRLSETYQRPPFSKEPLEKRSSAFAGGSSAGPHICSRRCNGVRSQCVCHPLGASSRKPSAADGVKNGFAVSSLAEFAVDFKDKQRSEAAAVSQKKLQKGKHLRLIVSIMDLSFMTTVV